MECDFFGNFLLRAITIHADGDKWADHGGSALPQGGWSSRPPEFKTPGRADPLWSADFCPEGEVCWDGTSSEIFFCVP
jgi:hypothetical protein